MDRTPARPAGELTLCYNGSCPVCRAEIGHYRARTRPEDGVLYRDVAVEDGAAALHPALAGDTGFRRLHALTEDGRLLAGVDAFVAVWERLPRYRWLARLVRRRPVRALAGLAYDRAAAPLLFLLHRRRQRRKAATAAA